MQTNIKLMRAIGTEFLARKFKGIILLFGIGVMIVVAVLLWLTTFDVWWWLLAGPVIMIAIFGILISIAAWFALRILRPGLTKEQSGEVIGFVDKVERVTENIQSPMPIIVLRILKDIVLPGEKTFLQKLAEDSKTLHPDFIKLRQHFKHQ